MQSSPSPFDKSMLECPVCFEIRKGKRIYVCTVGHAICEVCFGKIDPKICPEGRCSYTKPVATRNFAMETMIEAALQGMESCQFSECGCSFQTRSKAALDRHLATCEYKTYFMCPADTVCKMWLGSGLLNSHLRNHKNVSWMADDNCKMPVTEKWLMKKAEHLKASKSNWNVVVINYDEKLFAVRLAKKNGVWYTWVQLLSSSVNTGKYSVEIKAEFKEGDSAYFFRGDVVSSSDNADEVIRKSRCLVLTTECVANCLAEDGISKGSVEAGFDCRLTVTYNIISNRKSIFKK